MPKREGVEPDFGGGADLGRDVGRQSDAPARSAMHRDGLLEAHPIVVVQRAEGFVEKPKRCRDYQQPGQRKAAPLASRQPAAWPVVHRLEGKSGKR